MPLLRYLFFLRYSAWGVQCVTGVFTWENEKGGVMLHRDKGVRQVAQI